MSRVSAETGNCARFRSGSRRTALSSFSSRSGSGVEHQQSRPDRDQYVKIQFDNVYSRESSRYYDTFNQPYDFGSQMHYSFRLPDGVEVGQREANDQGDVALLKAMYQCGAWM
uniref:Metalloendopeptidase n=1 Tax=Macrostomum lignano TaxID=282301 RepID=A0A1I8GSI2_9PLAT